MRITEVNIPADNTLGLKEIKMKKLGQVVVLAGKNGSGKSRILNKLRYTLPEKPSKSKVDDAKRNIEMFRTTIQNAEQQIKSLKTAGVRNENTYNYHLSSKQLAEQQISELKKILSWNLITTDYKGANNSAIAFVPKTLVLQDSGALSKSALTQTHKMSFEPGMNNIHNSTFATIQVLQDRWFNTSHQLSSVDKIEKDKAEKDYNNLKEIIFKFLETTLDRDYDGYATLFNQRLTNLTFQMVKK